MNGLALVAIGCLTGWAPGRPDCQSCVIFADAPSSEEGRTWFCRLCKEGPADCATGLPGIRLSVCRLRTTVIGTGLRCRLATRPNPVCCWSGRDTNEGNRVNRRAALHPCDTLVGSLLYQPSMFESCSDIENTMRSRARPRSLNGTSIIRRQSPWIFRG
jgi:hypothetical protein